MTEKARVFWLMTRPNRRVGLVLVCLITLTLGSAWSCLLSETFRQPFT